MKTRYPKQTKGTKVVAAVRKRANSWSREKRDTLLQRGMDIINGKIKI